MHIYCGIDPGCSGAVALVLSDGRVVGVYPMPVSAMATRELFLTLPFPRLTLIERVHSSPQMGVVSAFTFGRAAERAEMAVAMRGWNYHFVHPQRWQQALDCRTRGDKSVTKALAARLFPDVRVTNRTADALLIAECCRRKMEW